jgi:hypothetical protein
MSKKLILSLFDINLKLRLKIYRNNFIDKPKKILPILFPKV